jgi:hypothetical protein
MAANYAEDFVKLYMEFLPKGPGINRAAHQTIAVTVGGALHVVLARFKYDLQREERKDG